MPAPSWHESLTATPEDMAHFQQERVILDATERICELMEEAGVTRAELASRLKTSKSHVSQLLSGRRNMTLRTLSDLYCALGRTLRVEDDSIVKVERLVGLEASPRHVDRFARASKNIEILDSLPRSPVYGVTASGAGKAALSPSHGLAG